MDSIHRLPFLAMSYYVHVKPYDVCVFSLKLVWRRYLQACVPFVLLHIPFDIMRIATSRTKPKTCPKSTPESLYS